MSKIYFVLIFTGFFTHFSSSAKDLHTSIEQDDLQNFLTILSADKNINRQDDKGRTALHVAVLNFRPFFIGHLIHSKDINLNIKDNFGRTPLHYSAELSHKKRKIKNVKDLVDKIKRPFKFHYWFQENIMSFELRKEGSKSFDFSAELRIKFNLNKKNLKNGYLLSNLFNYKQLGKLLIKAGADANIQDNEGRTSLYRAVEKNSKDLARFILEEGHGDINIKDNYGQTVLYRSLDKKNTEFAELLLEYGAHVNVGDSYLLRPLHYTAWKGRQDMTELLLKNGADINAQDNEGNTPLHHIIQRDFIDSKGSVDIAEYLISEGADVTLQNKNNKTFLDLVSKSQSKKFKALQQDLF